MKRRQKTEFGEFLVKEIKNANMSQEEFYNAVGIKKPYFYDLLTASPPPVDLQNQMLSVLDAKTGTNVERRCTFYNLAAQGRGEIPADIVSMITDYPDNVEEIRKLLTQYLQSKNKE